MTNLTDTQLVVLTAACQRLDQLSLPLPAHLKGGAADKVVRALLAKGLIEESRPAEMCLSGGKRTTAGGSR